MCTHFFIFHVRRTPYGYLVYCKVTEWLDTLTCDSKYVKETCRGDFPSVQGTEYCDGRYVKKNQRRDHIAKKHSGLMIARNIVEGSWNEYCTNERR